MSEPFIGEIRMFAGNFAPQGWAFCDGQLLSTSQNDALFSLLGTIYGGDGRTTYGLPDMRGRIPIHQGSGPGLSPRRQGAKAGVERVTLNVNQLPRHNHGAMLGSDYSADSGDPTGRVPGTTDYCIPPDPPDASSECTNLDVRIYNDQSPDYPTNAKTGSTGGNQGDPNIMPFLCIHFIISLFGIYPSR